MKFQILTASIIKEKGLIGVIKSKLKQKKIVKNLYLLFSNIIYYLILIIDFIISHSIKLTKYTYLL